MLGCSENIVNTMVFKGFPVSGKVGICDNLGGFGTSFWEVLGCLGEHFGGLGGSWEQIGILMDSGTLPRGTQILRACPKGGSNAGSWAVVQATNTIAASNKEYKAVNYTTTKLQGLQRLQGCKLSNYKGNRLSTILAIPSQPGGP